MDLLHLDQLDIVIHSKLAYFGWTAEAIVELILAALCGGLVGLEREVRGRQAGFRTNLLVAVGSALAMVVSNHVAHVPWGQHSPGVNINIDPARIAYGVMAGIGFLGAGTIVQTKGSVRGLTTAAGLWCVSAIGLGAGLGMYVVTIAATLLVLTTLWVLDYFENMLPTTHFRTIKVRCQWQPGAIERVVDWLKSFKFKVIDVHFERTENLKDVEVAVVVSFSDKRLLYELERRDHTERQLELMAIRLP